MPGVLENRRKWSEHNWEHGGHRWSPGGTSRGTDMMWLRSVRPRIQAHLPACTVLEIAPGYGRWTEYLLGECDRLLAVDITDRCIGVCRERFRDRSHAQFFVNDGESLPMVPDRSVDFAFSLDSLVHVEAPQIGRYLQELARTLKPGGAAFLHHSNLGAYRDPATGEIPAFVRERHWRAPTLSAREFRKCCADAGLSCVSQEVINWIGRDADVDRHRLPASQIPLTDCLSVCVPGREDDETAVYVNRRFVDEWRQLVDLTRVYGEPAGPSTAPAPSGRDEAAGGGSRTAGRLRRRAGRARAWLHGCEFAVREPIARAIRAGRCPDCGTRAARREPDGLRCSTCRVRFILR